MQEYRRCFPCVRLKADTPAIEHNFFQHREQGRPRTPHQSKGSTRQKSFKVARQNDVFGERNGVALMGLRNEVEAAAAVQWVRSVGDVIYAISMKLAQTSSLPARRPLPIGSVIRKLHDTDGARDAKQHPCVYII